MHSYHKLKTQTFYKLQFKAPGKGSVIKSPLFMTPEFISMGKHCVVGTNAVVRGVFPDYCVIVGVPAQSVKRYNESTGKWKKTNKSGEFLHEI